VVPGLTGSMITGATYFGFIESTKDWLEEERPNLAGPWVHFCAGAMGMPLSVFFSVELSLVIYPFLLRLSGMMVVLLGSQKSSAPIK
jgi:hypothetical protein